MNIADVNKSVKGAKSRKRRGRGPASGLGKTAGHGMKGWGQRAGPKFLIGFAGGQKRLMERMPKRGFNNAVFATEYVPVNLALLEERFGAGETADAETLKAKGVTVRRTDKIKILGTGDLTKALTVKAHAFSKSAREKIEKAGGKAEVLQ